MHFVVAFFAISLIICAHAQAWDTDERFDGIDERFDIADEKTTGDTGSPVMEANYDFPEGRRGKIHTTK